MARIAEIADQNPWWRHNKEFERYDQHLKKAKPIFFKRKEIGFKKGNIYILRGPRQVGKTTYLKDIVRKLIERGVPSKSILYLSLDFFTSRREMRNAINYFLDSTRDAPKIYLLLDEITSIDNWNLEIKFMADQGVTKRGVIVATGSSAVKLKVKGGLLPGRGLEGNEYYIKPLSFREFAIQTIDYIAKSRSRDEFRSGLERLKSVLKDCSLILEYSLKDMRKEIQKVIPFKRELGYLFRIYLINGGFPGVINHYLSNRYEKDTEIIMPEVSEIFIRDVLGDLQKVQKQEIIARQILKGIVKRYGSRYTFSRFSREIERTHITAIDYLEFLEDSFISFILYAYNFNKKEPKWKGDKKVYFFDPFIFHSIQSYLTGGEIWDVITRTMEEEELQSKLVEGMAISHLLLNREIPILKTPRTFLWFYYDRGGREIDAIIKENSGYLAVEVKYRAQVTERKITPNIPVEKFIILSKEDIGTNKRILTVPIDLFLSLLPISSKNI